MPANPSPIELFARITAMMRVHTAALLLSVVIAPSWAMGQSQDTVVYYHTDAIGSVRAITDEAGQVVARYDFLPFGEEFPPTPDTHVPLQFAGKERDYDTGFDYVGARYYQSQTGRFTSPDPITVNALRIVNPQRWNRYAYAVNNPLRYVDPDGLDALLINYTDGAHGLGHVGIMALNPDGSGLYGGFNPVNAGRPIDRGIVKNMSFPAGTSLAELRRQLAKLDGKSPQAIRIRRIKTSDAETAALTAYIQQSINARSTYVVGLNDCLDFCVRGLWSAGIPAPPPSVVSPVPDLYFGSFWLDMASRLSEWWRQPTPKVDTTYCFNGINCN
jgi:RHS repeat-associated protein